jgi:hypothetical protein
MEFKDVLKKNFRTDEADGSGFNNDYIYVMNNDLSIENMRVLYAANNKIHQVSESYCMYSLLAWRETFSPHHSLRKSIDI